MSQFYQTNGRWYSSKITPTYFEFYIRNAPSHYPGQFGEDFSQEMIRIQTLYDVGGIVRIWDELMRLGHEPISDSQYRFEDGKETACIQFLFRDLGLPWMILNEPKEQWVKEYLVQSHELSS